MNLDTTIEFDLKKFFHWWGGELAFLVPSGLRRRLRDRQGYLIISPSRQGYLLEFFDDDKLIAQKSIASADTAGYQQLKNQDPAIEKTEVVLRLASEHALQRVIFLPAAAQENLQQVVGFELDRYTPFKPEQVYFSAVVLGKTEQGQIRVLLIVVPNNFLDQQLAAMEALAVPPHRVDYQATVSEFPQIRDAYNLLPERYRQRGSRLNQSIHWLLSGILLLLTIAALVGPVWLEGRAVDSLKSRIKQLEKQTRLVEAQQREIDALRGETQKLIDIKDQSPALLGVLAELSSLLKDDTWLTHLQYSNKHLQIQGQSPAASALISLLEGSAFFSKVSFVSPLTQDKTTGRERFQISSDVSMPVTIAVESGNTRDDASSNDQSNSEQSPPEAIPEAAAEVKSD